MGNFEKLIVLLVLFLSAIVLAVSLTQGDEEGDSNPLQAAERPAEKSPATRGPRDRQGAGQDSGRPALASEVRTQPPAGGGEASSSATATSEDGRRRVLRLREGLEPSPLEDFMIYECAAGDTWSSLADDFYGNRKLVALLRGANEGLERPIADEAILVPIYDFRREGGRPRAEPAPRRALTNDTAATAPPRGPAPSVPAGPLVVDGMYSVQNGDNLSTISQKVYGKSSRWREIWNANRDRLQDPDWLDVGMKLRIPER